jgi:hypothetical protein
MGIHIEHFPGCTPHYPEKPAGEPPQPISRIELDQDDHVYQCGDCGALSQIFKNTPQEINIP